MGTPVGDLELELDAFEGPFDLLLTLVLKEELDLADVEVAGVVLTFLERQAAESEVDLELCGEFLVLAAALLELKARGLFPDENGAELEELDPDEEAEELAERLALYRRVRDAASWLAGRLEEESTRFFRQGPAPFQAPKPEPSPQDPARLAKALRALATEPPAPSVAHLALDLPSLGLYLERFRALVRRRRRFVFDEEVRELERIDQAVALLALLELWKAGELSLGQAGHCEPITVWRGNSNS